MNTDAKSEVGQFRSSSLARRISSVILGALILGYLAIITYSFSYGLRSIRSIVVLVILWGLGIVALTLLSRAWRNAFSKKQAL
jgi:hypothetical protein